MLIVKGNGYKIVIISCWAFLLVAITIKLFGTKFFDILVTNVSFVNFCNYIDNRLWLKYIVATFVYIPSTYLAYLSISKQKIGKDWWVILIAIFIPMLKGSIIWLGFVVEIFIIFAYPLIKNKLKNWKREIIGLAIIFGYQIVVLLLRDLGLFFVDNNSTIVGIIMNIDYYIIILLFYLYTLKILEKEQKRMGIWGLFFFGEFDKEIVKDIAKEHNLPVEKVEVAYKEMLKKLELEAKEDK